MFRNKAASVWFIMVLLLKMTFSATIVDMAGRSLIIPEKITKVYSTSPMGQILMYTLNPDKICGLVYPLSEEEKEFLLDSYKKKPLLGGWYGKNTTGNPENIIKAAPDIILSMGDIDGTNRTFTERMQKMLNIPVVMVDGSIEMTDSAYRFTGRIIGEKMRADILSDYCRNVFSVLARINAEVNKNRKKRVYYAEGTQGLETDSRGSMHTEVLEMTGGDNVADLQVSQGFGRIAVSIEQVIVWNPEMIITCTDHGSAGGSRNFDFITNSIIWKNVDAVRNGEVFKIPSVPFGWFDRPPSVNRIIGLLWLVNLMYPDIAGIDIRKETRKYYSLFYHRELTDRELDMILDHAERE